MRKYKYKAVNLNGKKIQGTFLAENEKDLREKLALQGLYLVSSKVTTDKSPNAFFSMTGKTSARELANFARQFSIMITSGTSIVDSLAVLKEQSYTGYFKKVLELVFEAVKSGQLLSEAMGKHKSAFPNFFVSMVKIGELSGQLDAVLVSVADYLESDEKLKRKTKSALAYPILLIIMAIAIIVLVVAFVIPTFQRSLASLDVEMPPLTLAVIDISNFFTQNWMYIFLAVVGIALLFIVFIRTKQGRQLWDKFKFHCPLVRGVVRGNVAARFCRAFSLLIAGGMDIVDAMDEVLVVFGNKYVEQQFRRATDDVRQGMTLTAALEKYKIFPLMLTQMVSVGEKTGKVDEVLARSAPYFESQVEQALTTATSLIQPVILIIIGACVGLLFYSVYAPITAALDTSYGN